MSFTAVVDAATRTTMYSLGTTAVFTGGTAAVLSVPFVLKSGYEFIINFDNISSKDLFYKDLMSMVCYIDPFKTNPCGPLQAYLLPSLTSLFLGLQLFNRGNELISLSVRNVRAV